MGRIIFNDFKKMFGNRNIYLSIVIMGSIFILVNISRVIGIRVTGNYISIMQSTLNNEIMLILFLFSIVGGGFLYCMEEKHNYIQFEILRIGVKKFTMSKIVVSVTGGFLTAFISTMLGCVGTEIYLIINRAEREGVLWNQLFNYMSYTIMLALLCGILSTMGFVVTTILSNFYIGMVFPLIIYYVVVIFNSRFPIPEMFKIEIVYFEMAGMNINNGLIYGILYTLCLLILLYWIAGKCIRRRLEHA